MNAFNLLPFKLFVVPTLIWVISYVGRRWRPLAAGGLSAFPVVVGPTLLFVAIEQGNAFAARAAIGSISAVLALVGFSLAYAWSATRLAWWWSIGLAIMVYLAVIVGIHEVNLSLMAASAWVIGLLAVVPRLIPRWRQSDSSKPGFRLDVPFRMLIGGGLVYGLTVSAAEIGPSWSGIFAMFPVTGSVLLLFSHILHGREFAINLVHGMFLGWCSITAFCIALSCALPQFGIASSFAIAFVAAVAIMGISYMVRK